MKAHALHTKSADIPLDWLAPIRQELQDVEECLSSIIQSDVGLVYDLSKHLLSAGGKRIRPALVLLAAQASGSAQVNNKRLTRIAVAAELIHMATLVHDDVIDHSESRRGRMTANAFWGNKLAVLSGDCILAKAFHLLSEDADQRILQTIAQMTIQMSESEVLQTLCEHDLSGWQTNYWQIIHNKTASFLSTCCRCGAIIAGASSEVEESLAEYGMQLGIAFQLTDDILDIAGDPEITGKPVGNDLREGKATLPVLLALENMAETDRLDTFALIANPEPAQEQIESLCEIIKASSAIESARAQAKEFSERAVDVLESLPSSDAKDALTALARTTVDRTN